MTVKLNEFNQSRVRTDLPDIKPGHVVKVYQKITETKGSGKKQETKERTQVFEGLIIGKKGGKGINATITVRKLSGGIGVERVFPLNTPTIEKIKLVKITKTRRAKLNYMRKRVGKATKPKGELVKPEENKSDSNERKKKADKEENKKDEKKKDEKKLEIEKTEDKKENVEKKNEDNK